MLGYFMYLCVLRFASSLSLSLSLSLVSRDYVLSFFFETTDITLEKGDLLVREP